jgi:hypothetical protein
MPCAAVAKLSPELLRKSLETLGISTDRSETLFWQPDDAMRLRIVQILLKQIPYLSSQFYNSNDLQLILSANIYDTKYLYFKHPNSVFCPASSSKPVNVFPGYYATNQTKFTRSDQRICSEGSYCEHGISKECAAGRYGDRRGQSSADCSGLCPQNYYCYPGSVNALQFQCPIGRYGGEGEAPPCSNSCLHVNDYPCSRG